MDFKDFLHEKMRSLGAETYERFLLSELLYYWNDSVDKSISAKVKPVKIEHGILFVEVKSSAFKDQLKFLEEELLDTINEIFNQGKILVKEIRPAQGFQIADKLPDKKPQAAQINKKELTVDDMILTEEEIKRCEEQAKKVSNEELRQTVYRTLIGHAKYQKFRLATGWHKCKDCENLCEPEEIFCEACKIKERKIMTRKLFDIFYDEPYLKAQDAQKILLQKMPYMKRECALNVIESARTSLIQNIASKVRFGDEESPDVLKLVALEKRLPLDKLTPAIIRRTLIDLQFDLSEQPKLQRYFSQKSAHK